LGRTGAHQKVAAAFIIAIDIVLRDDVMEVIHGLLHILMGGFCFFIVEPELGDSLGQAEKGHGKTAVAAGCAITADIGFNNADIEGGIDVFQMIPCGQACVSAADNNNIRFLGAFETGIGRYGVGQGFQPPAFGFVVIHFLSPLKKLTLDRGCFSDIIFS